MPYYPYNYMPDADKLLTQDVRGNGTGYLFSVETRIDLQPQDFIDLSNDLANGDDPLAAYDRLYGTFLNTMGVDTPGHALVQAAFGILHVNPVAANAARARAVARGIQPRPVPKP